MPLRQISPILFAVSVLLCLWTPNRLAAQFSFPTLTVQVLKDPAPGYYFLAPATLDSIACLDNSGRFVYRVKAGSHTNILTYKDRWLTHFIAEQGINGYVRRGTDLKAIDTFRVSTPYVTDFHEARIVSDTSYIILGTNVVTMDLSKVFPGGDPVASVWANIIQERTFDGRTLFSWNSLDHIPVTDCADTADIMGNFVDYLHVNSVIKDTDGNYIVSARHLDEIFKIDRRTGSLLWRMGGSRSRNNQFRFLNDTTGGFFGFSHQHTASRTSSGTILIFDNGNLKPEPQVSRVVEYEVDEVNKTARRVWQYVPTPNVYVRTMGSAEELENGNILVGYGSASNTMLAQEVDRDGKVQFQVANLGMNGLSSYRVHKSTFRMTGVFKRLTSTGTMVMSKGDSTTHLTLGITRLDSATTAVAERHSYAPHSITVTGGTACGVIASRWVVRIKNIGAVAGTMRFNVGNVPGVEYPEQVRLYHRTNEGQGAFSLLDAVYAPETKSVTVNTIRNGEYFIAYPNCLAPNLLEPSQGATEVAAAPLLRWSEAIGIGVYDVEVSTDPSFTNVTRRFSTARLDTTISAFPEFTQVFWRVRSRTNAGVGPWSIVGRFTTVLGVPTLRTPVVTGKDTVAILPGHVFEWTTATGALQYRLRITPVGADEPVLDTLLIGRSFRPTTLAESTPHTWNVRAVNDTVVGRPSTEGFFVTAPPAPSLTEPRSDEVGVPSSSAMFRWESVEGATLYDVVIRRASDSSMLLRDSVTVPELVVASLPPAERCVWTVRARGRYGPGPYAPQRSFTTVSSLRLPAPLTYLPKLDGSVDTVSISFRWSRVPDAAAYDLQITTRTTFDEADIERTGLTDTSIVIPSLLGGTPYAWRVIASSPGVTGTWSDTACFTTRVAPGQGLTPVLPLNGATDVTTAGTLVYTTAAPYISYEVVVDDDPSFSSPDFRTESPIGSCSYAELRPGTLYFWRVVGIYSDGRRETGPPARFRVQPTTSVGPEPSDGAGITAVYTSGDELVILSSASGHQPRTVSMYTIEGRLLERSQALTTGDRWTLPLPQYRGMVVIVVTEPGRSPYTTAILRR